MSGGELDRGISHILELVEPVAHLAQDVSD